jgi:hypothetical protein
MQFNRKTGRLLLQVLAVFFTVLLLFAFSLAWYWKPTIAQAISKNIELSTNNLYSVTFKDLHINFLTGNFSIDSLRLKPNVSVYKKLDQTNQAPLYLFSIIIKKLEIKNTHPIQYYFNKKLYINKLNIEKPIITVYYNELRAKRNKPTVNKYQNPYELIKNSMISLNVKDIIFKNTTLCIQIDSATNKNRQFIFLSNFYVKNLKIDAASQTNHHPFYADDIGLRIRDFSFTNKDSSYNFKIEECTASTASNGFSVYNLAINPKLPEQNFCDKYGYQKTRYDFNFKSLIFKNFNFEEFIYHQVFRAELLEINKMKSNINLNKTYKINPFRERKFPQQIPFDIELPLTINKIKLLNSEINYSELTPQDNLRWQISFNKLKGTIDNFTNEEIKINQNKLLKIDFDFLLNNEAKTNLSLGLYYGDYKKSFYCNGEMGAYNLAKLNAILKPLSKIEIANCRLKRLGIKLKGDKMGVNANISMNYKNLRVKVLAFDSRDNQLKHQKLYSFLANVMVLSNDNPSVYGKFVQPQFYLARKPQQGFFNLIWKSILKGCKESIGYTEKIELEMKQKAKNYKGLRNGSQ